MSIKVQFNPNNSTRVGALHNSGGTVHRAITEVGRKASVVIAEERRWAHQYGNNQYQKSDGFFLQWLSNILLLVGH